MSQGFELYLDDILEAIRRTRGASRSRSSRRTSWFEFFEGTTTVNSSSPRVTVRKSGQLVLTEAAVALLGEGVEQVQIGYNDKARAVGIRPATEGGRGVLKLRAQPNGRSRLIDAKRFFAHHSLTVEKARGIEVEEFGGGVVGFRLPEEVAGGEGVEAEAPAKAAKPRRKAAAG